MKYILIAFFVFFFNNHLQSQEKYFNVKGSSNIYVEPSIEASIIYPIELGKEMILKETKDEWYYLLDELTGLAGWGLKEDFALEKPKGLSGKRNYDQSFKKFKENVMQMSASIKEAISVDTFLDVKHIGGAAAIVIADNNWFKGRRHPNQAFQVYDLWKNANQSPSFLSFRNENDEEQFIILSGPHRPRYLKSVK